MEKIKAEGVANLDVLSQLAQDPDIRSFLTKEQKDASFLKKNASDFLLWKETLKKCEDCPGLASCCQTMYGYRKMLHVDEDGFLIQVYEPCEYQKQVDRLHAHKKYFLVSHCSLQDYEIDLSSLVKNQSGTYLQAFKTVYDSIKNEKGIYLYGQPGVGKTYLMLGLSNHYAKEKKSVCFVKVPQLISELKQTVLDGSYRKKIMATLQQTDILILDDIGAESVTSWTRDDILLPILEYRMVHRSKTYFTSNYAPEELFSQYVLRNEANSKVSAMRILERIRSLSDFCKLSGESRR